MWNVEKLLFWVGILKVYVQYSTFWYNHLLVFGFHSAHVLSMLGCNFLTQLFFVFVFLWVGCISVDVCYVFQIFVCWIYVVFWYKFFVFCMCIAFCKQIATCCSRVCVDLRLKFSIWSNFRFFNISNFQHFKDFKFLRFHTFQISQFFSKISNFSDFKNFTYFIFHKHLHLFLLITPI